MRRMAGLIENVLTERFGLPTILPSELGAEHRWNTDEEGLECILFEPLVWDERLRCKHGILEALYGDAKGGFLLGDTLKVSLLEGPRVFGLYLIDELRSQPDVRRAHELDREICFFMDSANVWFYGLKAGELFVYDSGTRELNDLGPVQPAMQQVLIEFEEAERQ